MTPSAAQHSARVASAMGVDTATTDVMRESRGTTGSGAGSGVSTGATRGDDSFEARARAAADRFEGFFIGQMLHQMRSGANAFADEDSAARDPLNADMLSLADGLLADSLAGRHAFGIADAILRQLLPKAGEGADIERSPA